MIPHNSSLRQLWRERRSLVIGVYRHSLSHRFLICVIQLYPYIRTTSMTEFALLRLKIAIDRLPCSIIEKKAENPLPKRGGFFLIISIQTRGGVKSESGYLFKQCTIKWTSYPSKSSKAIQETTSHEHQCII